MSYEIRDSDFVVLRTFTHHLSVLTEWDELIECSLRYLGKLVTNECLCWNEWNPGFGEPKHIQVVEDYHDTAVLVLPSLSETIDYHPVLSSIGWKGLRDIPHRLSDYESISKFRENPLFKEVYIYLDAHYQLAYHFATTSSAELLISMNRRLRDFDKRESQLLKLAGDTIAPFAQKIHQRQQAQKQTRIISSLMESAYGLTKIETLSPGEILLLKHLASGQSVSSIANTRNIRRDTVSRQLSRAREKLRLTSNKELLSVLRAPDTFMRYESTEQVIRATKQQLP